MAVPELLRLSDARIMKLFAQSFHCARMRGRASPRTGFQYNRGLSVSAHTGPPIVEKSEIDQLAALARLRVSPAEADEVATRIGEILAMIDQLQAVDTEGVEPLAHPLDAMQRLRADEVTETDRRDELLELAPSSRNGLLLVPKVIE